VRRESALILLSYASIYIVWGSTYFFIKMAVSTIPPFYVVGMRFLFGGILFMLLSVITGKLKKFPSFREIISACILGVFLLIIGNGLISIAEKEVDSYFVALVIACTPIIVAFFNRVLFRMRIALIRLIGILIGVTGVGFLLYDGQSLSSSFSPGVIMVITGVCSWGFATSIGHRLKTHPDSLVNSGIQMLFAGVVSFIIVSINNPPLPQIFHQFSNESIIGVTYLAVVGSMAFSAYSFLIAHEPSIRIVSYSLVNPLIAVFLGLIVGDETPAPYLWVGFPFILAGLAFMLYGEIILKKLNTLLKINK